MSLDATFSFAEGEPSPVTEIGLDVRRTTKGDYVMEDFEATPVAQDAIRLDLYDDDLDGTTKGRYTKNVSLCQAMAMVVILVDAIQKCEVMTAVGAKAKGAKPK